MTVVVKSALLTNASDILTFLGNAKWRKVYADEATIEGSDMDMKTGKFDKLNL